MKQGQLLIKLRSDEGLSSNADENLYDSCVKHGIDMELMESEVADAMQEVLMTLGIDTSEDDNTKGTAKRVAKMYMREVFAGKYEAPPTVTKFSNTKGSKDLQVLGPIDIKSACSHHLVPIVGKAWIGFIPNEKVMGISKFHRIVKHHARRPQIQEGLIETIHKDLKEKLDTDNVAVFIEAQHMCMTWRGVEAPQESVMISSAISGVFDTNDATRAEFFRLVKR